MVITVSRFLVMGAFCLLGAGCGSVDKSSSRQLPPKHSDKGDIPLRVGNVCGYDHNRASLWICGWLGQFMDLRKLSDVQMASHNAEGKTCPAKYGELANSKLGPALEISVESPNPTDKLYLDVTFKYDKSPVLAKITLVFEGQSWQCQNADFTRINHPGAKIKNNDSAKKQIDEVKLSIDCTGGQLEHHITADGKVKITAPADGENETTIDRTTARKIFSLAGDVRDSIVDGAYYISSADFKEIARLEIRCDGVVRKFVVGHDITNRPCPQKLRSLLMEMSGLSKW